MINFKDTFSKMKNGAVYLSVSEEDQSTDLFSIPEDQGIRNQYPDLFSGMGLYSKAPKVEPMKTYYADDSNWFNFMSKSNFNLKTRAMIGIPTVKVNSFDFFSHGEEYMTWDMVW
jgi:hypothetical protein